MNPPLYPGIIFVFFLTACSPYKKVTLTMSDRLTTRWKGSSESQVTAGMGTYKSRAVLTDGFLVRFDYSYPILAPMPSHNGVQIKASNQPQSLAPRPTDAYHSRERRDSVIKRIDFYFDRTSHVQQVLATGFPDSVYYVKRK